MGNSNSNTSIEKDNEKYKASNKFFWNILDDIATQYILTMDFISMENLHKTEYCNNLVILTSDIIKKYFTNLEIQRLSKRVENGIDISDIESLFKENISFFNKQDLNKMDILSLNDKANICNNIAKFYVKVAHLFASIVMTLNPVYMYHDENGKLIKKSLYEKHTIPANTPYKIFKLGICNKRIQALKKGQLSDSEIMNPVMCYFNHDANGNLKTLDKEPGIHELIELYYDNYDYDTATFNGMTPETEKQFKKDLESFYKIFTGMDENDMKERNIQKFSDISLRDYSKVNGCQGNNHPYTSKVHKTEQNKQLFELYAENLRKMMSNAEDNQEKLLEIMNEIFTCIDCENKKFIIHPLLTESKLKNIIVKTREIIVNMYLECENDYTEGLKIYQAIVEKQIKKTTESQIIQLENIRYMNEFDEKR